MSDFCTNLTYHTLKMSTVGSGLEESVVQVYGYAVGKLPNIFPSAVIETYGIHAGDDAVAVVSILPILLLNLILV